LIWRLQRIPGRGVQRGAHSRFLEAFTAAAGPPGMTRTVPHRPHTLAAAPFEVKIAVSLGPAVPGDRTLPALGCSRGLGTIQTGYSCSSARVQIEHLCERMRNELHGIAKAAFRWLHGIDRMEGESPTSCGATRLMNCGRRSTCRHAANRTQLPRPHPPWPPFRCCANVRLPD